jgi:hypothetical protein
MFGQELFLCSTGSVGGLFSSQTPIVQKDCQRRKCPRLWVVSYCRCRSPHVSPEAFGERYMFELIYMESCILPSGEKVVGVSFIGKGVGSFSWVRADAQAKEKIGRKAHTLQFCCLLK